MYACDQRRHGCVLLLHTCIIMQSMHALPRVCMSCVAEMQNWLQEAAAVAPQSHHSPRPFAPVLSRAPCPRHHRWQIQGGSKPQACDRADQIGCASVKCLSFRSLRSASGCNSAAVWLGTAWHSARKLAATQPHCPAASGVSPACSAARNPPQKALPQPASMQIATHRRRETSCSCATHQILICRLDAGTLKVFIDRGTDSTSQCGRCSPVTSTMLVSGTAGTAQAPPPRCDTKAPSAPHRSDTSCAPSSCSRPASCITQSAIGAQLVHAARTTAARQPQPQLQLHPARAASTAPSSCSHLASCKG